MTLSKGLILIGVLLKNTGRNFFQDNGFFLAMGLAYNLLLYFIPLTLLMISALGYTILDSERAMTAVQAVVQQFLPESEQEFVQSLAAIVADRGLLGVIGFMLFIFFSSTLFGSVRYVLNIIFNAEGGRGFIQGLGRDFLMMSLTALLSILTMAMAALLTLARTGGREHLPLLGPVLEPFWLAAAKLLTLVFLASLFYGFYRFAPARTLGQGALLVASVSGTLLFELARWGFAWYVAFAQESPPLYGALGGLIFFFFWLYYASLVFVLGAEIGHAYEEAR